MISAIIFVLALVVLLISLMIGSMLGANYYACLGYKEATGRPTKFVNGTCYGQIDGIWYSNDEYNKIFVAERKSIELKETK